MANIVQLHNHTGIGSIQDSTVFPDELPKRAKECGMKAVAITEHGYLTSSIDFYLACKNLDIKPIIGCEMYATDDMNVKDTTSKSYHLILLSKNTIGYNNLKELCTRARLDGFYNKPKIDYNLLSKHCDGLICCSACVGGELPKMIMNDEYSDKDYIKYINNYKALFGDDFYLEVQPANNPIQIEVNKKLVELSGLTGTELVATCDTHFLYKEDFKMHNAFISTNQNRDNEVYKDCWFKNYDEMYDGLVVQIGQDLTLKALNNTNIIADKCNLEIDLSHSYLPKATLPVGVKTEDEYIDILIKEGMVKKGFNDKQEYWDRINYEMDIIRKKDFVGYFLILANAIKDFKDMGYPIAPARGSSGGSLVTNVLDITDIDPIKYGLDFGRFLTLERMSLPKILGIMFELYCLEVC